MAKAELKGQAANPRLEAQMEEILRTELMATKLSDSLMSLGQLQEEPLKQAYEEDSNRTSNILLNKTEELRLRTNLLPLAQPSPAVEDRSSSVAQQKVSPVKKNTMTTTPTSKADQAGPTKLAFPSLSMAFTVQGSHEEGHS